MKIKLDENMPLSAADVLADAGHDVDSTHDEDLDGSPDEHVIERATREARLVMTLDRGLGDIRTYAPGSHAGIVVLRLADQRIEEVDAAVADLAGRNLEAWAGAIVIYQDGEIRVRWPPST